MNQIEELQELLRKAERERKEKGIELWEQLLPPNHNKSSLSTSTTPVPRLLPKDFFSGWKETE